MLQKCAAVIMVCALAASAAAADVAKFTVLNTSDVARDEYLCVSIPFKPGQVALNKLVIEGKPTGWRVLTRYPDKSVMIAQAQAKLALKPNEKATFKIVPGEALPVPMDVVEPVLKLTLELTTEGGKVLKAAVKRGKTLEQTGLRTVARYRGVITNADGKEPLGITVYKETWHNHSRGHMDVMIASDSLHKPLPVVKFKQLALVAEGIRLAPLWPQKEGQIEVTTEGQRTRVVLLGSDYIGDNTGKAYRFAYGPIDDGYVETMAGRPLYPLATPATFKARQAAIGILGYVPALAKGVTEKKAWDYLGATYLGRYKGPKGPWDHLGYACMKGPGATGDQVDFGVLAMFRTYQSGHPGALYNIMPAMFRESCRMNQFYGLDAQDLIPKKVVFWTERFHHRMMGPVTLGRGQKHWDIIYKGRYHHGWSGYDDQHFSLNHKYEAWTLTGNWLLHGQLAGHYQTIALGQLNHFWYSHGIGQRAMGRVTHAALLASRATGDDWLVAELVKKYVKHALPAFRANQKRYGVAAIALWRNMKDGRVPNLAEPGKPNDLVCNWQEGLIAWAVGQLPDKRMKQMAYEAGKTMCLTGFDFESRRVKTYYSAADPSKFTTGGIGSTWFYPSMRWAATEAIRRGDPDAAKMKLAADTVLRGIRGGKLEGYVFAPYQRWTAIPEK